MCLLLCSLNLQLSSWHKCWWCAYREQQNSVHICLISISAFFCLVAGGRQLGILRECDIEITRISRRIITSVPCMHILSAWSASRIFCQIARAAQYKATLASIKTIILKDQLSFFGLYCARPIAHFFLARNRFITSASPPNDTAFYNTIHVNSRWQGTEGSCSSGLQQQQQHNESRGHAAHDDDQRKAAPTYEAGV